MDAPEPKPKPPPGKLRWYQFSLRSLLLFVGICGALLGWVGSFARRAIEHGQAIRRVEALGGTVWYFAPMRDSLVPPPGPSALRSVFGDKAFAQVSSVDLGSSRSLVDADLQLFRRLPEVSIVRLCGNQITDKGIENLSGLGNLRVVNLLDTRATTGGLARLLPATWLQVLDLSGRTVTDPTLADADRFISLVTLRVISAGVTDSGLAPLASLRSLKDLSLRDCPAINGAGLANLRPLQDLWRLDLAGTKARDVGIGYISKLPNLRDLNLAGTAVTDVGIEKLAQLTKLESLNIEGTNVTDAAVPALARLKKLRLLNLGPGITAAGATRLWHELPLSPSLSLPKGAGQRKWFDGVTGKFR